MTLGDGVRSAGMAAGMGGGGGTDWLRCSGSLGAKIESPMSRAAASFFSRSCSGRSAHELRRSGAAGASQGFGCVASSRGLRGLCGACKSSGGPLETSMEDRFGLPLSASWTDCANETLRSSRRLPADGKVENWERGGSSRC